LPEMAETARRHECAVEADVVTGADLTDPPPAYSRPGEAGRSVDEALVLSPVEDPAQRDLLRGPGSLAGRCRAPAADCRAPAADCRTSTAGGRRPGQVPGCGQQRVDELLQACAVEVNANPRGGGDPAEVRAQAVGDVDHRRGGRQPEHRRIVGPWGQLGLDACGELGGGGLRSQPGEEQLEPG